MSAAEEAYLLEIPIILDERRCHPLFQLAELLDVIAAAHRNLGEG